MKNEFKIRLTTRRVMGFVGIALAAPYFIWLMLGWIPGIPSIIETYGVNGLKVPAGVMIGGLLLAAFGFEEF